MAHFQRIDELCKSAQMSSFSGSTLLTNGHMREILCDGNMASDYRCKFRLTKFPRQQSDRKMKDRKWCGFQSHRFMER